MKDTGEISALRFAVPVAIESTVTTVIGMVFSMIIGGISGSALVAVGTTNQLVSFLSALLSMLTVGSAVLVARYVGAKDAANTSRAVEQSILMTALLSTALVGLVIAATRPILYLLLPNGQEELISEAAVYLRVTMLSFPFMMFYNVLVGILRSTGNSRAPMFIAIAMNVVQLLCAVLFLRVWDMDMLGAGLVCIVSRLFGAIVILYVVIHRGGNAYHVHLPNLVRLDGEMWRTILRVGMPTSFDSLSVQAGYVVANSLTVGLGTQAASVAQVVNTINSFPSIVHGVCTAVAMPVIGRYIGAKRRDMAMKSARSIWIACMSLSLGIALVFALLGERVTMLYTQDAFVAQESAFLLWTMLLYHLFGASINAVDPALKTGGEQKYVMMQNSLGVWLVRIPLSWLFGYAFGWGIRGVYAANYISLATRAVIGLVKRERGTWIHDEL